MKRPPARQKSDSTKAIPMKPLPLSQPNGFTLVEIMIVVAIIGLLATIAIPNFLKARQTAQGNSCLSNLRLIDSSKQQWATENNKQGSDTPDRGALAPYIGRNQKFPACPIGSSTDYTINAVTNTPVCGNASTNLHNAYLN